MNSVELLSKLFTDTFQGQAWHGPSLQTIINDVTPEQAAYQPGHSVHSIAEFVYHAAYWMKAVRHWASDEAFTPDQPASWGPNGVLPEQNWNDAKATLTAEYDLLKKVIDTFPEEKLAAIAYAESGLTYYTLLHGLVHHNLYHAAQIAILKKLQ